MHRLRLSTLLILINVGLLLLAVTGVAVTAARLLQQLSDRQALARVTQAGLTAHAQIERAGDSALTSAQLLAERPTLLRLLQANDIAALAPFLAQFQRTSGLDGSAVLRNGRVVSSSGAPLPWELIAAEHVSADRFLYPLAGEPLAQGARATIPGLNGAQVLVATLLDETFTRSLSDELGLAVAILPPAPIQPGGEQIVAARDDALARYQALVPLRSPSGDLLGTIQTTLPTTGVALSLQQLIQTLLLLSLGMAMLAALASFLLGRRLSRPLRTLTGAAARIGRGDLDTPILVATGGEIGTLAATLEEMRWRLLRLTADLRRQQSESQAIITGIVEGVFSVDRERRIRYVNPQAAALLGLSEREMIGRFCGDVLNPMGADGRRPCAEHCPIVHARFRGGAHATERLALRDGSLRSVVITSAPFADEQQVQVLRDETEVEATRRLRDAVLANISHEFRTPLSAQLASIDLLLDQLPDLSTEQIGQLILSLQRGTLRLTQLIDNLLESARIEAGRHAIRRRPVALDEVVEGALELTRPLLRQREQEAIVDLPFPLPLILGDAPLLTQVFVNLLANANKFAPARSTITIGGEVADAEVTLWVEDQGPGLPTSNGAALFGRFVRSGADEPEQSGVGLGLWIVQSIVERHDGRVEAQGARFSVVLPRESVVSLTIDIDSANIGE
ncbi:MAG TPA: ATP-binding protein [Roseiflexaceae bacterium]|nr:ATP-binding protein [Roseiflexaceae bacterium]